MPSTEISLIELKNILVSKGIFSKDDPKLEEATKLIFDYLKDLIRPIKIPSTKPDPNTQVLTKPRSPKEESIVNIYRLVLGREPSVNDLSYLSSLNIQEDVLLRRMIESLEHAEIVKARQEVLVSRIGYNQMRRELEDVSASLKDRMGILANMQEILEQKNASYEDLSIKYETLSRKLKELTVIDETKSNTSFVDRVLDWFNKRFG